VNYTQLSQAIQDYVQSTETSFVANIPLFVQLAEERIYNAVDLPSLRKNVLGSLTANNKYLALPGDFLSVFSLAVINAAGEYEYLLNKDVNFIRQSYPQPTDTGIPKYYAIFGPNSSSVNELTIIVGPTPDASYNVEFHYFYYPESIVTAGTSWLGDNFETFLLYGSLREAVIFQKGEQDMVAYYEQKYQESLALLRELGDGKDRRSAYRDGQLKLPVPGPVR
jgi:hypothetical protein